MKLKTIKTVAMFLFSYLIAIPAAILAFYVLIGKGLSVVTPLEAFRAGAVIMAGRLTGLAARKYVDKRKERC